MIQGAAWHSSRALRGRAFHGQRLKAQAIDGVRLGADEQRMDRFPRGLGIATRDAFHDGAVGGDEIGDIGPGAALNGKGQAERGFDRRGPARR